MDFIGGTTVKNSTPIDLPEVVKVDKCNYLVIGTITHMGTANAGHNRAYLKSGSKWFLCEDPRLPIEKQPIDSSAE